MNPKFDIGLRCSMLTFHCMTEQIEAYCSHPQECWGEARASPCWPSLRQSLSSNCLLRGNEKQKLKTWLKQEGRNENPALPSFEEQLPWPLSLQASSAASLALQRALEDM